MGISVLGPDVNESGENFTPLKDEGGELGSIRFGLSAVKGVGDVGGKCIVEERLRGGAFNDFSDLSNGWTVKQSIKGFREFDQNGWF